MISIGGACLQYFAKIITQMDWLSNQTLKEKLPPHSSNRIRKKLQFCFNIDKNLNSPTNF